MCNVEWNQLVLNEQVSHIANLEYDLNMIVLETETRGEVRKKEFRFEPMWLIDQTWKDIIASQ